ncbi:MAG: PHP domain-containing protein [Clostridia bacterium]|nr:PHP domain-containing protein [Clostridia bacterium]
MRICDLHTHSNYSDGSFSPSELVAEAERVGLSAIALTDHNNVGGIAEFLVECNKRNIEGVIGTEFSTDYESTELHILGLFIKEEFLADVNALCEEVRRNKDISNRIMIERLARAGYDISYDEVRAFCKGTMNRAHIGEILYKKGYTKTVKEVFSTILSKKGEFYHSAKRLDVFKTIEFIKSIGAVPVLAHPFLDLDEASLREFLPKAIECGLVGMETVYSTYTQDETLLAKQIAREFNLKESGGSDFHGYRKADISLATGRGNLEIPYELYQNLRPQKEEICT